MSDTLDKIFKQLQKEAIPAEWYNYEIKRTNQIIRAAFEKQEQQIKELKEYTEHKNTCEMLYDEKDNCSCGLNKALKK